MNSAIQTSRLAGMIRATLAIDPSAPALEFEQHWHSWGELDNAAQALDQALDALKLGEGVRIGTLMRNRPELAAVLIALFSSGRCLATLNAHAPDDALAADIERVQSPVIVGLAADLARPAVRAAIARSGAVALVLTGDTSNPVTRDPELPGDHARWSNSQCIKMTAPDIAIEMLTSGTTGAPKRIPLPYRNLEKALLGAAAFEKGRRESGAPTLRSGVQIVSAPMAHIAGVTAVMNNILAGRRICLLEKFSVEGFRDAVVRHRPKVAGAPPSALRMIMDANIPREDLSSLAAYRTGTAPLDPDLADAFFERYGIPVLQNYGATEFAGGAAGWTLEDFKAFWKLKRGSVGRINPGLEARIVDPTTGATLAPGSEGLLEMRGANIGDGETFVRTTDLAVLDADGFLFIKGRHDGAIIRGGFKILPPDLIKALEQHPAIREAGVVGLADERLGQIPAAAYILKTGAPAPGDDELKIFLRERLMPYQIPVLLKAVADFPRTPSLKINQPALKALLEAEAKSQSTAQDSTAADNATTGLAHRKADQRIPLPTETVGELLRQHAQRIGDRPAVHSIVDEASDTIETYSWCQLLELAENVARWLLAHSKPGDRIAVWSRNEFEAVLVQYGCALSGTILVHLNTAWTDTEVEHALNLVEPTLAFVGKDHAGRDLQDRLMRLANCKVLPLTEIKRIAREKSARPLPIVKQSDPCLIQFTSGTTGKAKAALQSHRAMVLGGGLRPRCEGATENDVWLNAVPFHHIGGSCAVAMGALGVGGSFVVLQRFDREQLIRLMPKVRATRMGGVPTMWHDMLASPNLSASVKLNSVSLGGASVPPEVAQAIFDRLGARCGIGYGQSEFSIISATMPEDPVELVCTSVGRPLPYVEMKIINPETGATLRYGEAGEICLRGPMCMDGYWNNPKATAETIDSEGFLHTGDMGTLDADGICRVKGRVREMIIRGGENIYPAEIENALMTHPAVVMAAVVGVDHPRLGQEVGAAVKLKAGVEVSIAELEAHVGKFVASFKVPRQWRFVDAMPMTASGKIRKVELEPLFK